MKNIFLLSALYHALHQRVLLSLTDTTLLDGVDVSIDISFSPLFPDIGDA